MTKGSSFLKHGASQSLVNWLRESPQGKLPWRLNLRLGYGAFWFERLLQMRPPADTRDDAFTRSPGFVMGFWRSGTTLLHNLLYERFSCCTPLTWQCYSPATFTLQRPPDGDVMIRRPMDDGIIHLLGPQEDEFALLLLGEQSLYRGFLDPGRLPEIVEACLSDDNPNLPRWQAFVDALGGDEPVVLKSPNHVFRLDAIQRAWPDARMIWICRRFEDVLQSNIRMWKAMISLHRLRPGKYDLFSFLERLASRYRTIIASFLTDRTRPMLWLEYDDLISRTDLVSDSAACFLGLVPREFSSSKMVDATVHVGRTEKSSPVILNHRLRMLAQDIDDLHATALRTWGRQCI